MRRLTAKAIGKTYPCRCTIGKTKQFFDTIRAVLNTSSRNRTYPRCRRSRRTYPRRRRFRRTHPSSAISATTSVPRQHSNACINPFAEPLRPSRITDETSLARDNRRPFTIRIVIRVSATQINSRMSIVQRTRILCKMPRSAAQ